MSRCHICNTFFEKELERPGKTLTEWMRSHQVISQLQFLPLLYASPTDIILVSDLPPNPDPRLHLIDNPPPISSLEHWGPSQAISSWAKKHNIPYSIPNWKIIQEINSKVFSFTHSPKLPNAKLILSQEELDEWIATTPGPKVLKTPFGTAGTGHFHLKENVKRLYTYPLIGEPWVERLFDFSTQWDQGKLLGVTLFENEPNGTYKGTFAGTIDPIILQEHLNIAEPLVEKIKQMGYSGNLGIDAYVYLWNGQQRLQPIVEINARKTMSWASLTTSKSLYYTRSSLGLLPSSLNATQFTRNIICT